MDNKKSPQYVKLLDLVKHNESNKNSIQVQEKASKLWNDVKGIPSDCLELVATLEKRIKKSRNTAVSKSFVKKTQKTTGNESNCNI